MSPASPSRAFRLLPPALLAVALAFAASCAKPAATIAPADLISVDQLAANLADSSAVHPALLHVGFEPLFRSDHIPGSVYVGAGSKPAGIEGLKRAIAEVPAGKPIVLYCGCCPWEDCPNVHPAFAAAKSTGRSDIRVLHITGNFERDWVAKGYPAEKSEP